MHFEGVVQSSLMDIASYTDLRALLLYLLDDGLNWRRETEETNSQITLFTAFFPPFARREELTAVLPSPEKLTGNFGYQYLYLRPPERSRRGTIALLYAKWEDKDEHNQRPWRLGLHVGIFIPFSDGNSSPSGGALQQIQTTHGFVGYRFEMPESLGGSDHDYYHAQPIKEFGMEDTLVDWSPEWMPVRFPAFPLLASNPATLAGTLAISLYGARKIENLLDLSLSPTTSDGLRNILVQQHT